MLATSSTASIIGMENMRNSSFSSPPAFLRIHLILHTAGKRKCSLSSLPNRIMVEFVICPFIVSLALFKNVTSSHALISASRSGCNSMNYSRALTIARGSRSSIVASRIIYEDQFLFMTAEVILQVLEFFLFATLILFRVLLDEILL